MRVTRATWGTTLTQLIADRTALVEYAAHFATDPAEAERAVDDALVAVVARGRLRRAASNAAAVRREVRHAFGTARRSTLAQPPAVPTLPQDPAQRMLTLAARVRRRRRVRAAVVVAAAVGVVGLGGAAVYGVGRLAPEDPSAPPPSIDSASTPASTPTAEPEAAVLGPVTVGSTLPEALPLRAGMLEAAGPGWSLVQYENESVDSGLIYLVSPSGELYEIPTPISGLDAQYRLAGWLPGSTLVALERTYGNGFSESFGFETDVVDLLTGERQLTVHHNLGGVPYGLTYATVTFIGDGSTDLLVSFAEFAGESSRRYQRTVRLALDGRERVAIEYSGAEGMGDSTLSPDGTMLALDHDGILRVISASSFLQVSTLTSPYPDRPAECSVARWAGRDQVLLTCSGPQTDEYGNRRHQEAWVASLDGGPPTRIASVVGWLDPWQVGDLMVVDIFGEDYLYLPRADGTRERSPVDAPGGITASAGGLLFGANASSDGPYDQALVAVDPVAGTVVELFGAHGEYDGIVAVVTHGDR